MLFLAILDYGQFGTEPEFESDKLWVAWELIKPLLDRDLKNYEKKVNQSAYATYAKMVRKRNGEPMPYQEWSELSEEEREQEKQYWSGSNRYRNGSDVSLSNNSNNNSYNSSNSYSYNYNHNYNHRRTAAGAASRYGADANGVRDYDPMIKKAIAQRMAKRKQEFEDDGIDGMEEEF